MGYLDIIERVLEEQRERGKTTTRKDISLLRLSELAKRNMAIGIYSQILGCEVWLCSNELMATQVKEDCADAVAYTAEEMIKILKLNPSPEDIRRIHEAKGVFPKSTVVDSKLKQEF